MQHLIYRCSAAAALALVLTGLLALAPTMPASSTSTLGGEAVAVQATSLAPDGTAATTTVADTGPLAGANDAREASQLTASAPSLMTADTPSAATISWDSQVDSYSSVNNLNLSVGGVVVTANSVVSIASAVGGPHSPRTGTALIDGLAVNGTPVVITGDQNQTVAIPGGQIIINETKSSGHTLTVHGLHIVMNGAADVLIASATASM